MPQLPVPSQISPEEYARLGLNRFVALDLETTGLESKSACIIEFGAVLFEGGAEVDRFSELVGIDKPLEPFITRLTGITDEDLAGKPSEEEVLPRFLDFVGDAPVVGQNVQFDLGFIASAAKRHTNPKLRKWKARAVYDTLILARTFFPTLPSFGLGALTRQFGVKLDDAHRAVHDAAATGMVLVEILKRARRTPYGIFVELNRLLGGTTHTLGSLVDGLMMIGPGDLGPEDLEMLPDNRIGDFAPSANYAPDEGLVVDDAYFDGFFEADGPLSEIVDHYQPREGQVEMAKDAYRALNEGGALLAEAGTGTGKSFAYLLPSLLYSRKYQKRVVVSTQTRHLQNQLFEKDLPNLSKVLGDGLRAVILKGRGNYVCRRRLEQMMSDPDALEPAEKTALLPLVKWLQMTRAGDISEVPAFRQGTIRGLWQKISSESGYCSGRHCRMAGQCFLQRIRGSAQRANVVLVNHALLFSDLVSGGAVLGEYDRLIIDEAHHVEKVAANHLAWTYNTPLLNALLYRIFEPKHGKGALVQLQAYSPMLASPLERGEAGADPIETAMENVGEALKTGDRFSTELEKLILESAEGESEYSRRVRYMSGDEEFKEIKPAIDKHRKSLLRLITSMTTLQKELDELDIEPTGDDDAVGELKRLITELSRVYDYFCKVTGQAQENTVFWYEIPRQVGKQQVRLFGAPLDVGQVLRQKLYPNLSGFVMTSATLAVDESFKYVIKRFGLTGEAIGKSYASPFDIRGQLYIAVADFVGTPKQMDEFTEKVGKLAGTLPEELDAGTLALFTNQRMMSRVYDSARKKLERAGWTTFMQGTGGAQAEMLTRFRAERRSVLFGVDSFWEGIDVPGNSLELAIIARLPFDVPSDPLVQARSERIEDEGGNPFIEYTVPEAALKLRQGVGRLIRTTEDVGVAVICDPRLTRSRWGRILQNSLPVRPVTYKRYEDMVEDLKGFLRGS